MSEEQAKYITTSAPEKIDVYTDLEIAFINVFSALALRTFCPTCKGTGLTGTALNAEICQCAEEAKEILFKAIDTFTVVYGCILSSKEDDLIEMLSNVLAKVGAVYLPGGQSFSRIVVTKDHVELFVIDSNNPDNEMSYRGHTFREAFQSAFKTTQEESK